MELKDHLIAEILSDIHQDELEIRPRLYDQHEFEMFEKSKAEHKEKCDKLISLYPREDLINHPNQIGIIHALKSIFNNNTVLHKYNRLNSMTQNQIIHSLGLNTSYSQLVEFKFLKSHYNEYLTALIELSSCIVGEIEFEMDIPDGVEIFMAFKIPSQYYEAVRGECVCEFIKDKKINVSPNARLFDDIDDLPDQKTADCLKQFEETIQTFWENNRNLESEFFTNLTEEIYTTCDNAIKEYRPQLMIQITNPNKLPARSNYYGKFKCKYINLDPEEAKFIRNCKGKLSLNCKEDIENIASLYD